MFDQLGAADHLALVVEQVGQELVFLRRQLDRLAVQRDAARSGVQPHIARSQFARGIARSPTDQRAQASDQFLGLERLGEIIVRACVQPRHLVRPAVARGEHEDGELAPFLAPHTEHGQPVDLRQAKVEDDGVIVFGRSEEMAVLAICREVDSIALALKRRLELLAERGFVLDDQDTHDPPSMNEARALRAKAPVVKRAA